ncbi:hypothetical protein [Clostridium botulinum]|uniref:hypothetical protein n=1 Tax=Clostridium botulinum TaxID=1491 RepID=UPI00030558C5|nr:hypothetical protein [Clostridium botulinum]MCD3204247.1 hypothetical protein [Clostridium botulinum C/D]MCD3224011.1 hypothetical protein [Clostridium botulinum C/D]MCD3231657.1 hypothetical protein [Clostridium botulinum C/D]MCD3254914.1 hypothetical protein [Clostridium botulinum C/D]MCD3274670.1 hypothetical protein [Clostridium botulinum C/D]
MGFFEKLGEIVGTVAGGVIGGGVSIIGEIVDSDFISEIGEGVYKASVNAGKTVGQATDGVANIASGIIKSDNYVLDEGIEQLGGAVCDTAKRIGNGVGYIASNGINVVEGLADGDNEKVMDSAKNFIKVAAIGTLAVGVGDYLGVLDIDGDIDVSHVSAIDTAHLDIHDVVDSSHVLGNSHSLDIDDFTDHSYNFHDVNIDDIHHNTELGPLQDHYVEPHYVNGYDKVNGTHVDGYWRDGDGNTNVNLSKSENGGYISSHHISKNNG